MKTITYYTYKHAFELYKAFNKKNRFRTVKVKENYAVKHAIEILKMYAIQKDIIILIRGRFFNEPLRTGSSERIRF